MESVLAKLFNGEIYPFEQLLPAFEEFREAVKSKREAEDKFASGLSEKQEQEFNDILDKILDISPMVETQSFIDGFKLGVKIMLEVLIVQG